MNNDVTSPGCVSSTMQDRKGRKMWVSPVYIYITALDHYIMQSVINNIHL